MAKGSIINKIIGLYFLSNIKYHAFQNVLFSLSLDANRPHSSLWHPILLNSETEESKRAFCVSEWAENASSMQLMMQQTLHILHTISLDMAHKLICTNADVKQSRTWILKWDWRNGAELSHITREKERQGWRACHTCARNKKNNIRRKMKKHKGNNSLWI